MSDGQPDQQGSEVRTQSSLPGLRCVAHLDQQVADVLVARFCGHVERGALVLGLHLEVGVNSIDWTDKDIGYQIDSSIGSGRYIYF